MPGEILARVWNPPSFHFFKRTKVFALPFKTSPIWSMKVRCSKQYKVEHSSSVDLWPIWYIANCKLMQLLGRVWGWVIHWTPGKYDGTYSSKILLYKKQTNITMKCPWQNSRLDNFSVVVIWLQHSSSHEQCRCSRKLFQIHRPAVALWFAFDFSNKFVFNYICTSFVLKKMVKRCSKCRHSLLKLSENCLEVCPVVPNLFQSGSKFVSKLS